ncbi:hypothetical protein H310_02110 [Aphanomyces invadans]|uniref:Uncharacterized protein n=1 Tax=Aphanomyces invadans TaxID=157072 RepID=A0A024UPS5_9STRA|nr:hypothetical protein H310_02110 [Aphanomyces invadans]ETW07643.1 hypothetical protein H310_02110 [Aphanomyces invadans]|eukprot:XP_008863736.1 hypothetical protein H310_02110 [Aphanomyces invadans]
MCLRRPWQFSMQQHWVHLVKMPPVLGWIAAVAVLCVSGVHPSASADVPPTRQVHRSLGWISGMYSIGRDDDAATFRLSVVDGYLKASAPAADDGNGSPRRQTWRVFRAHESDDRNMLQHVVEGTCLDAWSHKWMKTPLVHSFECSANETHQHWIVHPSAMGHAWIQPHYLSEWCLTVAFPNATASGQPEFADPTLDRCAEGRHDQLFYFYP